MGKKVLFITQNRNDAIWIVDDSVKESLINFKHNFYFFELKGKWNSKINIIINYILNILKLLYISINYNKLYFSWENPYVIFVKLLYPWKKIYMCVHHVEDYWGKSLVWKLIIKSVHKFIAISNFTKKQLIEIWAKSELIYLNYNWISKVFYTDIIKDFKNYPYVLYVWSELERKNIKWLLEWFKKVIEKYPKIKLIKIWLSGDYKQQIVNDNLITKMWLKNNVIFIREKFAFEELRKYYSNALCYISVSKLEWFWLTIPESLACSCPVVVSNIQPFKEIVWDSQILVNPDNIEDISNWIIKYIENKNFREKMVIEWLEIVWKYNRYNNVRNLVNFIK